jgi:hypothetical protein
MKNLYSSVYKIDICKYLSNYISSLNLLGIRPIYMNIFNHENLARRQMTYSNLLSAHFEKSLPWDFQLCISFSFLNILEIIALEEL